MNFSSTVVSLPDSSQLLQCQSFSCVQLFATPPGFSVHGVLQARILEWVAISFSRAITTTLGKHPSELCHHKLTLSLFELHVHAVMQYVFFCDWCSLLIIFFLWFHLIVVQQQLSEIIMENSLYVLQLLSCFSRVQFSATTQMAAHQATLSLGFSRQEYWSGLSFPSPPICVSLYNMYAQYIISHMKYICISTKYLSQFLDFSFS